MIFSPRTEKKYECFIGEERKEKRRNDAKKIFKYLPPFPPTYKTSRNETQQRKNEEMKIKKIIILSDGIGMTSTISSPNDENDLNRETDEDFSEDKDPLRCPIDGLVLESFRAISSSNGDDSDSRIEMYFLDS